MALSPVTHRRIATALAFVLAAESVSAVSVAAASVPTVHAGDDVAPARTLVAQRSVLTRAPRFVVAPSSVPAFALRIVEPVDRPASSAEATVPASAPEPAREAVPQRKPRPLDEVKSTKPASASKPGPSGTSGTSRTSAPKPAPKSERKPTGGSATYAGTNHVWIPSLGISKSVRSFPCSRTREPDNYMYRWGCAGDNNVYLLGHAYSVMKPLHDAYVSGRLKVGMRAFYAAGNGKVHEYAVKWWRVTRPTTDAAWAWAAQSVPSMTLQTCVGKNSEFRLMVRLVEVG